MTEAYDLSRPTTRDRFLKNKPGGLQQGKSRRLSSTIMSLIRFCQQLRNHRYFEPTIIGVILLAGVVVGLETSPALMESHGTLLKTLDRIILAIFVVEIGIKILAEWPRPLQYFRSGWNIFDFTIVAICLMPFAGPWVAVIRLARVLRILRLVTTVPKLQIIVGALLRSLPSMGYVGILLFLHFYIYAVLGTFFFRENDPSHFGNLGLSLITLFRVVTLEDWTDVMYSAMYGTDVYPAFGPILTGPEPEAFGIWAVIYFVSFVSIGAMVMINLVVGVMVTSISEAQAEQLREKLEVDQIEAHEEQIEATLDRIESQIADLRDQLRRR